MRVLRDPQIDAGDVTFECQFTLWGSERRPASKQKCLVVASSRKGVEKILKKRFPRSDKYQITVLDGDRTASGAGPRRHC